MNVITIQVDDITPATQYATAYDADGKPVATLQRRRVYEKGPAWKVFYTDGTLMFQTYTTPGAKYFAARIAAYMAARQ